MSLLYVDNHASAYFENVNFFTYVCQSSIFLHVQQFSFAFFKALKILVRVPVFTGILMAVYRYSVFAIPILSM